MFFVESLASMEEGDETLSDTNRKDVVNTEPVFVEGELRKEQEEKAKQQQMMQEEDDAKEEDVTDKDESSSEMS